MLKERVITAFVLTILLVAAVFLPMVGFISAMTVMTLMGAWEWTNLSGIVKTRYRFFYVLLMLVTLVGVLMLPPFELLLSTIGFWLIALLAIIFYPRSSQFWQHWLWRSVMGLMVLSAMWFSFIWIHRLPNGAWLILILWAIVALADIGAYFVGHAIGKTKLAPKVSPGKTREGAYGGIVCAAIVSFIATYLYAHTFEQALWGGAMAAMIAVASIVGDLFESMLKRFCGIKDSGNVLPGHGGVLDRIDGWTAAAPMFAFFLMMVMR